MSYSQLVMGSLKMKKIMTVLGDLDDDSFIFNTNRDDVI